MTFNIYDLVILSRDLLACVTEASLVDVLFFLDVTILEFPAVLSITFLNNLHVIRDRYGKVTNIFIDCYYFVHDSFSILLLPFLRLLTVNSVTFVCPSFVSIRVQGLHSHCVSIRLKLNCEGISLGKKYKRKIYLLHTLETGGIALEVLRPLAVH